MLLTNAGFSWRACRCAGLIARWIKNQTRHLALVKVFFLRGAAIWVSVLADFANAAIVL